MYIRSQKWHGGLVEWCREWLLIGREVLASTLEILDVVLFDIRGARASDT